MNKTYDPENDGFADYEQDYDLLALDPNDPDNYEDVDEGDADAEEEAWAAWGDDDSDLDPSEDDLEGEEDALEGEEDEDDLQGGDENEDGWDGNGDEEEWDEEEDEE